VRFGVCTPNFGSWADPRLLMRAADAARRAGWEAFFVWDHLSFVWGRPSADPWVLLTVAATAADGLLLGTAVTPVPRRRPQVLAQTVATLSELSGGRVVLGAGLGGNRKEFEAFGESYDRRRRLALFDEGLEQMREIWSPKRIPVWVGGTSPAMLERAARYDGWIADRAGKDAMQMSPDEIRERSRGIGGDVVVNGYSEPGERELVCAYEDAGGTWWLETLPDWRAPVEELIRRIEAGPPTRSS